MVMTSWFGSGTRNVKHETVANNILDENGHPIAQKLNERKDASGRTVYDCTDIMGKLRRNGEEYERPNGKFKYKCENGIEVITACVGTDRTGKALIKVGQTLNKDGFWHKCTFYPNNQTAIYTEETACNVNDKLYHLGDSIRSAFFLMKCTEDGYKIVGCYYIGTNKKEVDMKPGTTVEANGQIHHCDDNDGNIQYYATASSCMKYGNKYKEGEQFAANHLRYECHQGMVDIIGCYMGDMQRDIEIGDSIVDNHMIYRCYRENGTVKYEEYPCGLKGTPPCTAPPKQQIPSDLPIMSKMDPGFGAFSIVQNMKRGGGNVVAGSNTVELHVAPLNGLRSIHRSPST